MLGRNIHIGIGKETTRGTVASTISYLPKTSASFDSKVEKANNEASIGVLQDSYESNVVKEHAEGEVEQNLQMNAVSFLLLAAFGAVTSATDSAGAYKHDFTVAQNNSHPSMTIVVADDVQDYAYTNAMLDTLELSASANQYINLKTSWKARKGATTSATPTYSSNDLTFLAKNMTVKMANDEAGLSGATNICVETFSLNIQKNLQEEVCLGTTSPKDFPNTVFAVDGAIELLFKDNSWRTLAEGDVYKAMQVTIENTGVVIGATSTPELTFTMPKVSITEYNRSTGNADLVKVTMTYKALLDIATLTSIKATLVNTIATI